MKLSPSLALSTAVFYALGYPIGALAVHAATPGLVLVTRFVASAVILAAIVAAFRLEWPRGKDIGHAVIVGFLTQGTQFVGCYEAMRLGVSPVLVALIIAMNPVITAVIATPVLGEKIDMRRVFSVALAVVAIVVAFAGRLLEVGHVDAAVLWVVVAVFGLAGGGIYQQRFVRSGHPIALNAIGVTAALLPGGIFALLTHQEITDLPQAAWTIAVLVLANSVLAASLYMAAIKQAGAAAVSLLFGIIPSITALLAWAINGERPDIGVVIGLVIGAIACFLGIRRGNSDKTTAVGDAAALQANPTQVGEAPETVETESEPSRR